MKDIAIIAGNSNKQFAKNIANNLNIDLVKSNMTTFNNGECMIEINESVRDKDVFVIQSSSNEQTNDHLMELFLILDALKRSSCYRVTVVMPNLPYARQDRKVLPRVPISSKLIADLLQTAGMDRFLTTELHSPQIGAMFNCPVDNLYTGSLFLDFIKRKYKDNNICIVAPDAGSVKRAKMYAGRLNCDVAMIYKNRSAPGEISETKLIGDVTGKNCLIVDDMIDTAGTLCKAADELFKFGANKVEAYCTHAILSGNALDNINNSEISMIYVTDTILNYKVDHCRKLFKLSVANLFAKAIKSINEEKSLSYLFNY